MSGGFAGITPAPVPRAISGRRMGGAKNFRSKEMWGKAKLLVLQRVNEDAQMKGVKQLVDSAVRQNSLVAMEKAEERRRAQKRLQGKGVDEGTLTVDHIRLLYLISRYTEDRDSTKWIRSIPLAVLTYEGVVADIFDWDYAPTIMTVSGLRATVNLSQEGRSAVDELREQGMLHGLKLSSKNYQYTNAFQISQRGRKFLERRVSEQDMELVDDLIVSPHSDEDELVQVVWDASRRAWNLVAPGFSKVSTFTDVESVSYVSSPYIPPSALKGTQSCTDNSDRVGELQDAGSTIKDSSLDEAISLGDVHVLIGEWIPLGANAMMMLNDTLGASERVQGGFFSKDVDENPEETVWQGAADGLTAVNILDWDETGYVNYEAEVHFKGRSPGIVQVENFGVHVHESGAVCYGLRLEAVMDRIAKGISLDLLSRVLVETTSDTSRVADNLLTQHQRSMLELTFLNDAATRQKYVVVMCESISPKKRAMEYLDHGELENEMKQILGDTYAAHDLSDSEVLVVGQNGLLCAGAGALRHEKMLLIFLGLMSRNVFMRTLFKRTFILNDDMKRVRRLIETYEEDPQAIETVRALLGKIAEDISELSNIATYLLESLKTTVIDESTLDGGSQRVAHVLQLRALHDKMDRRTRDIAQLVSIAREDMTQLSSMAEDISADQQFRVQEEVQHNTKHLTEVSRASERTTSTLELMQVVLGGSLAFAMVDRVGGLYLGIAADIGWAVELFDPILQTPGAWLGVNMCWWLVLAALLLKLMKRLSLGGMGKCSLHPSLSPFPYRRALPHCAGSHADPILDRPLPIKRCSDLSCAHSCSLCVLFCVCYQVT